MNAIRIAGLVAALCLGLMLGLMFGGGGTHVAALVLIAAGGALMLAICAWAEWR